MKNKILLLIILLFINLNVFAKPKIATSITPIASIIAMLIEDNAEVSVINIASGCPHHYQMRPSDKQNIADAEMLIYIDNNFDTYAAHLASNFKGKVVKISDFEAINFLDEDGVKNWHFWLDLDNVLILHEELAKVIKAEIPSLSKIIDDNMNKAKEKISSLKLLKKHSMGSIGETVILSDSLAHFIKGIDSVVVKLYQKHSSSLRNLDNLEYILNTDKPQCIVLDNTQDPTIYKKFNKKIIQLEAENWQMPTNISHDFDLFCTKYLKMINQLSTCR